jgi:hypothetical protein
MSQFFPIHERNFVSHNIRYTKFGKYSFPSMREILCLITYDTQNLGKKKRKTYTEADCVTSHICVVAWFPSVSYSALLWCHVPLHWQVFTLKH